MANRDFFTLAAPEAAFRISIYVTSATLLVLAMVFLYLSVRQFYKPFPFWQRFDCELNRAANNPRSNRYYQLSYLFQGLALFWATFFCELYVTEDLLAIKLMAIASLGFIILVAIIRTEDHMFLHNFFFFLVLCTATSKIVMIGMQRYPVVAWGYIAFLVGFITVSGLAFLVKDKWKRKHVLVVGERACLYAIFTTIIMLQI